MSPGEPQTQCFVFTYTEFYLSLHHHPAVSAAPPKLIHPRISPGRSGIAAGTAACSAVCKHNRWHRSPQRPCAMPVGTSPRDKNHKLTPILAPFLLVSYLPRQRPPLPPSGCRIAPKEPLKGNFPIFFQEPKQTVSTESSETLPLQTHAASSSGRT